MIRDDVTGDAEPVMPLETQYDEYAAYLQRRSKLGKWYRKHWLYPRLSTCLKGGLLDIGCGIGDMLAYRPGSVGVDVNPHNVTYCRERGLDAKVMDPDQLPFAEASFDSVLLDNVLEHIEQPSNLLAEIARVLRPGGHLLIGVPGHRGQASDPDHKQFYDEAALLRLASQSGFRIIQFLYSPLWRSNCLSQRLRQYCIYSLWLPVSDVSH
ncbi:MAG: hypothetical protein CK604_05270 [Curvibacter sp. PD_MW3]|nr:MAG: hypothetical protein CK604_05270 [Curvibacter sp. PD_MW3]